MRMIRLFEIDWDRENHALPSEINYVMDDQSEAAWERIIEESLHLDAFGARLLFRAVSAVQAERDHRCAINFCKIWVGESVPKLATLIRPSQKPGELLPLPPMNAADRV